MYFFILLFIHCKQGNGNIESKAVGTEKHVEEVLEEVSEVVYEFPTQLSHIKQIFPKSAEEECLGSLTALATRKKLKIAKRSLEGTSRFF